MRLHCISFLSLLAALFCCSCEKDGGKVSATFESEQYYVLTGHQIQIDFKLQPETADPISLAWSSSDESVATVSAGCTNPCRGAAENPPSLKIPYT